VEKKVFGDYDSDGRVASQTWNDTEAIRSRHFPQRKRNKILQKPSIWEVLRSPGAGEIIECEVLGLEGWEFILGDRKIKKGYNKIKMISN